MDNPEIVYKYFPELTKIQRDQIYNLGGLYRDWNSRINVISRKDIDLLYERHVLHSLGIAKIIQFEPGSRIIDVGTGGGFPGIPLAILFPDSSFFLIDSIGKKIKVVNNIIEELGIKNAKAEQIRAERTSGTYEFMVSRAVTSMKTFTYWANNKISEDSFNKLENGILSLKGGDLIQELKELKKPCNIFDLKNYYAEEFFESKKVVHLPVTS